MADTADGRRDGNEVLTHHLEAMAAREQCEVRLAGEGSDGIAGGIMAIDHTRPDVALVLAEMIASLTGTLVQMAAAAPAMPPRADDSSSAGYL